MASRTRKGTGSTRARKARAPAIPPDVATYVYCVVHAAAEPSPKGAPAGLAGTGPLRLLAGGTGLWLVVGAAPLDRYGSAPIAEKLQDLDWVSRHALAHEAVVEHFMQHGTVLPMKIFTLFHNDARALEHIAANGPRLKAVLRRIQGCAEWGVRVRLDEVRARRHAAEAARPAAGPVSGAGFLLQKKKAQEAARDVVSRAQHEAAGIYERLLPLAADGRQVPVAGAAGANLLLDANFLVARSGFDAFEAEVRRAAGELARHGIDVTLSGPWPPYHFIGEAA